MTTTDPSIPGAHRLPAPSSAFPWFSALWVVVITGVVYAISATHHVSARVGVIETARIHEVETQHTREVDLARELAEMRAENATTARILVDVLNEVRESRGKSATSFSAATESARQRAEQERGE